MNNSIYKETAFEIGVKLAKTALWHNNTCTWLGSSIEYTEGRYDLVHRSFSCDMYSGTAGISWFLAHLYKYTEDELIIETLEGAVNHILSYHDSNNVQSDYGIYGGRLGMALTVMKAGELASRKDWTDRGTQMLLSICMKPIKEFEIDVIAGVAGAIPVIISNYHKLKLDDLLQTALKCGNFLIERAQKEEDGWFWNTPPMNKGLTGYSHGSAGMSVAFYELHKLTGEEKYLQAGNMAILYEQKHFQSACANWTDLRLTPVEEGQGVCGESWCHGAPGIALARLKAVELIGNPEHLHEAETALRTTAQSLQNSMLSPTKSVNFSLCHGLAGNADILLSAGLIRERPEWIQLAYSVGNYGIERYAKTGLNWPAGIVDPGGLFPGPFETPGLMLGLAGTGLFYLRLAYPHEIESILMLDADLGEKINS